MVHWLVFATQLSITPPSLKHPLDYGLGLKGWNLREDDMSLTLTCRHIPYEISCPAIVVMHYSKNCNSSHWTHGDQMSARIKTIISISARLDKIIHIWSISRFAKSASFSGQIPRPKDCEKKHVRAFFASHEKSPCQLQASRFLSMTSACWRPSKLGKIAATWSSVVDNYWLSKPKEWRRRDLGISTVVQMLKPSRQNSSHVVATHATSFTKIRRDLPRGQQNKECQLIQSTLIGCLSCLIFLQLSGWIEIHKEIAAAFWPFRMNSIS